MRSRQLPTFKSRSSDDVIERATSEGHRVFGCARFESRSWNLVDSNGEGEREGECCLGTDIVERETYINYVCAGTKLVAGIARCDDDVWSKVGIGAKYDVYRENLVTESC
jgi:hypothetical protein